MENLLKGINKKGLFIFVILLSSLLITPGCNEKEDSSGGKIGVIVSISPQAEMVGRIGGDKVSVTVMVPPGSSPHTYEPKPSQLAEASRAKAYVKVGSGVEFELAWMDKILAVNRNLKLIDSSVGIEKILSQDADEPGMDVHIWTSVRNAKKMAENVYSGLAELDPANAAYYKSNMDSYLSELDVLDSLISNETSAMKEKKFIVYHPAWGYFSADYGLEQIGIEQEGKEPSARWMEKVIKSARENNITVIFASPEFSTTSAETLAKEINGRVVLVDPLAEDYSANMQKVAEAFAAS
ncbi:MAG: zinc ABC transporter substrate-binding protein [Candidatus Altiarchaeia archaeon]